MIAVTLDLNKFVKENDIKHEWPSLNRLQKAEKRELKIRRAAEYF